MRNRYRLLITVPLVLIGTLLLIGPDAHAQQTVGLFLNTEGSENGYTLFRRNNTVYLIDNCGYLVHEWTSDQQSGGSVYLLDNGDLLWSSSVTSPYPWAPGGGLINRYSWDNELIWTYTFARDTTHQHHDIQPMPNGNVLLLAWNIRSGEEAIANGRDPDKLSPAGILYESVVEVRPAGPDSGEVVWEWHLWDHLIQDFDSTRLNFGVVADHPERINLNYNSYSSDWHPDWIHANAVHYDAVRDEIIISARHFNEIWIIDHSTTTDEAAGHSGGRHGKGGDLIYRWGNPQTYHRGDATDRILYGQHDARFVQGYAPLEGHFMAFNNGDGRPDSAYSEVLIVNPPRDTQGRYILEPFDAYGPASPAWRYPNAPDHVPIYSRYLSGAHTLPGGNVLICEGNSGRITEVSSGGSIVWHYNSPVDHTGPVVQGTVIGDASVFRATRYLDDHSAFEGRELAAGDRIELNPITDSCKIYPSVGLNTVAPLRVGVRNTLFQAKLVLENPDQRTLDIVLVTLTGQVIRHVETNEAVAGIDATGLSPGMYLVAFSDRRTGRRAVVKVVHAR